MLPIVGQRFARLRDVSVAREGESCSLNRHKAEP